MPPRATMEPKLKRPGRPQPWCVTQAASISPTGKKRHRWFATREKAGVWIKAEEKRLASYSDKARSLSEEEKLEAAEAIPLAREHGFTLLEAAREMASRIVQRRKSVSCSALVAEVCEQLRLEKKSDKHLAAAAYVGRKFVVWFNDASVCDITPNDLAEQFNECIRTNAPASVKNFRRYVSMFLRHAEAKGYLQKNPLANHKLRLRDDAAISFLSPEQTRSLLEAAKPELRPYIALCAFAGLRPDEAKKLEWGDVLPEELYVRKANTKTRQHRRVPVMPNLVSWIKPFWASLGTVYYSRRYFRAAVEKAGLGEWKQDQLRHGFATYWLALHNDESRLAQIMGNSPEIIHRHYRVPVSKADAEAYFKITP